MRTYIGIIHQSEEEQVFGVSFPDFPGCISSADTLDELQYMAHEALQAHIALGVEYGDEIPEPCTLEQARAHEFYQEDAVGTMLVSVHIPGKTIRISLTTDEYDLAVIDKAVKKSGSKRSSFLIQAGLEKAQSIIRP